jgi:hypothetical protein
MLDAFLRPGGRVHPIGADVRLESPTDVRQAGKPDRRSGSAPAGGRFHSKGAVSYR